MSQFAEDLRLLLANITFDKKQSRWVNAKLPNVSRLEDMLYHNYHVYPKYKNSWLKNEDIESFAIESQINTESKFWFIKEETNEKDGQLVEKNSHEFIIKDGKYIRGGKLNIDGEFKEYVYLSTPKKYFSETSKNSEKLTVAIAGDNYIYMVGKPTLRIYFHLKCFTRGIREWVKFISEKLDSKGIPFTMKYLLNQKDYIYSDSAVLYISQSNYPLVLPFLHEVAVIFGNTEANLLRSSTPLFTKKLFRGIAIAEDPISNIDQSKEDTSFGRECCKRIVKMLEQESVKSLLEINSYNIESVIIKIERMVQNESLFNVEEPFRNPNTSFDYELPTFNEGREQTTYLPWWGDSGKLLFLKLAQKYADELCEKAIWVSSNNCTWITYIEEPVKDEKEYNRTCHKLVGKKELGLIKYFLEKFSQFVKDNDYYKRVYSSINYNTEIDGDIFSNEDFDRLMDHLVLDEIRKSYFKDYINTLVSKFEISLEDAIKIIENAIIKLNNDTELNVLIKDISLLPSLSQNNAPIQLAIEILHEIKRSMPLKMPKDELLNQVVIDGNITNLRNISERDALKLADIIMKRYESIDLPLRNTFNNYNFCPGIEGKAGIGLFFLILFVPSVTPNVRFLPETA
ncbi:T3SS effector HopA1 family protein [Flectobacillus rivi]|uniref:T3SS effector HopA1 family protein n=1 Tax=Flectobacillus rivi TaxID=2984209 RepID=A0ABT6Z0H6_9BACT|nr:T3SS effector HopA1 family protein [Flectobacillus rivi]MDI9874106.1 T3SS effector HopA1 family protein [Flectobacillus rivi]